MSAHQDEVYLHDMVRAARLIVQFAEDTDKENFQLNMLVQSAMLHQFLVLGEATKRLSDDFRTAYPEIPWRLIAGMRDRLIRDDSTT